MKKEFLDKTKLLVKSILPDKIWDFFRNNPLKEVIRQKNANAIYQKWAAEIKPSQKSINFQTLKNGVNIIGYLSADNGLGEAARCTIKSLQHSNIPYFEFDLKQYREDAFDKDGFPYKINILHVNPDTFSSLWQTVPPHVLTERYTIAVWYWELPNIPDSWIPIIGLVDEIWVATEFVRESIQKKTSKPVRIFPPAIQVETDKSLKRADFGLPEDIHLFLCAYDTYSVQARKNPMGAVEAFLKAFSPDDNNVGLVIKINHADYRKKEIIQLKQRLSAYRHIYFFEESFSRVKFNTLLELIDTYISLHRSEGFGLIPAECMYLGKPVIMTNWSGNLDFTRLDNSCPVNFKLIPVGKGIDVYDARQSWADPDVNQAAGYMHKLVSDKIFYKKISENAARSIRDLYGTEVIAEKLNNLLKQLDSW